MSGRLSKEDWIAAGFCALAETGPQALKAEPLARRLGTSKGSFYHHFRDVPAFQDAMLELWHAKAFSDIVDGLSHLPTPRARLRALAKVANEAAPDRFGGLRVEPAIRAWSLHDERVAWAVSEIDARRIAYVVELFRACGLPPELATPFYASFIGLDDLLARGQVGSDGGLATLLAQLLPDPA